MKRFLTICVLLFAFAVQAGAQNKQQPAITVNGLVVDSNDMPFVGATVYIKDEPGTGNITNSEGRFTLKAKLYNTLVVSFVGYETVEQILTSDDDDQVPLFAYSGVPQFMYGFGAEVRYKNWTLNVLFKGTGNNYFLYGGKDGSKFDGYIPFNQGYKGNVLTLAYDPANRWTSAEYSGNKATENPHARFPRLSYGNNANNTKPSTFWKGNARYLRLQELSLNYNLRTPGLRKALGLQSIDFQVMCENLAVWDGVDIFDPEQAMDTGHAYPIPRRFSLQIYLNF